MCNRIYNYRTWNVTDCAGNTTSHVQVITVEDNTDPVFDTSSLPADATVECDDSIPALEDVVITATDNCANISDIVITPSEVITNQNDDCSKLTPSPEHGLLLIVREIQLNMNKQLM